MDNSSSVALKDNSHSLFLKQTKIGHERLPSKSNAPITLGEIFRKVAKTADNVKTQTLPFKVKHNVICLTSDNNLLCSSQNEEGIRSLSLWSISSNKHLFLEKLGDRFVSKVFSKVDNKFYFIGYENGNLEARSSTTFKIAFQLKDLGTIVDIVSDERKYILVSNQAGKVYHINLQDGNYSRTEFEGSVVNCIVDALKVTKNGKFACGWQSKHPLEVCLFWKMDTKMLYQEESLDLDENETIREDPNKLVTFSSDEHMVVMREKRKGIKIMSLEDGTLIQKILKIHTNPILQILMSSDNQKIYTSSKDRRIRVTDWIKGKVKTFSSCHSGNVTSIALTARDQYLLSGSEDLTVSIFSTRDQYQLATLNVGFAIDTITLSLDQQVLLILGKDKQAAILQIEENRSTVRINFKVEAIQECMTSSDENFLLLTNQEDTLELWNLQSKVQVSDFKIEAGWNAICVAHHAQFFFYQSQVGEVIIYDLLNKKVEGILTGQHSAQIAYMVVDQQDKFLYTVGWDSKAHVWDVENKTHACELEGTNDKFHVASLSHDDKWLIASDYNHQFSVYSTQTRKLVKRVMTDYMIYDLAVTLDNKYFVVGGQYSECHVYSLDPIQEVKQLLGHRSNVLYVSATSDGRFVLTCSETETVIWDVQKWETICDIEEKTYLCFSQHRLLKGLLHDGYYKSWTEKLIKELYDDYEIQDLDDANDDDFEFDEEVIQLQGPMNHIAPIFLKNMLNSRKSEQVHWVEALSSVKILPYNLNILHFMSYYNNPEGVSMALHLKSKYQRDKFKQTPLSYAMQRNSYDCTQYLLEYIMETTNIYEQMKASEVTDIIKFSPANLKEFFDNAIVVQELNVPAYGKLKSPPMSFILSQNSELQEFESSQMVTPSRYEKEATPIIFKSFKFLYNYVPGSRESMELHTSLHASQSDDIFECEAVKVLLQYKWSLVRRYAYIGLFLTFLLVVFLICYNELGRDNENWIIPIVVLGIIFFLTDLQQLLQNMQAYLSSFWNMFDLFRFLLIIAFTVISTNIGPRVQDENGDYDDGYYYYLLAFLNLIAWIRFLSYLRVFKQMRALIRLVVEVCKDMVTFLVVLLLAIIAFTIITRINNHYKGIDNQFGEAIYEIYLLTYGEFDVEDYGPFDWIVFVLATLFMPLIMLNLLIAIMSDTYERVASDMIEADNRELNELILEHETFLFWNKSKHQSVHLHWVHTNQSQDPSVWTSRSQEIKKAINSGKGQTSSMQEQMGKYFREILQTQRILESTLKIRQDEQKRKIDFQSELIQEVKKQVAAMMSKNR